EPIWKAVGRDLAEPSEEDAEHDHREERLDDRPCHAERRLLVADLDFTPDEKEPELTVLQQFTEMRNRPCAGRLDRVSWQRRRIVSEKGGRRVNGGGHHFEGDG